MKAYSSRPLRLLVLCGAILIAAIVIGTAIMVDNFRERALSGRRHPARGMISPAEFIPVAEESGLIGQLGEWVLAMACRDVAG